MNENLDLTYDKWYRTLTRIHNFIKKYSVATDAGLEVFDQFESSNALTDFGGYHYKRSIEELEALENRLKKLDRSFNTIAFTVDNEWKMILIGTNAFKIVPIKLAVNGVIDFKILKNAKNI